MGAFLPDDEQKTYDNTVHNLRMRGWERADAEDRALEVIEKIRAARMACEDGARSNA